MIVTRVDSIHKVHSSKEIYILCLNGEVFYAEKGPVITPINDVFTKGDGSLDALIDIGSKLLWRRECTTKRS